MIAGVADHVIFRHTLLQLIDALFDRVDHAERVGAGLFADFENNRGCTVQARQRSRLFHTVFDVTDVADANRIAARRSHHNAGEISRILHSSQRAQRKLTAALLHAAAGNLHVLRGHRGAHLIDVQVVGVKLLAIQPDLNLARPVADELHLPHAAQRFDVFLDRVVHHFRGFAEIAAGGDHYVEDRRCVRRQLLHDRWIRVARQIAQYA